MWGEGGGGGSVSDIFSSNSRISCLCVSVWGGGGGDSVLNMADSRLKPFPHCVTFLCLYLFLSFCVCMCVCERESVCERERECVCVPSMINIMLYLKGESLFHWRALTQKLRLAVIHRQLYLLFAHN